MDKVSFNCDPSFRKSVMQLFPNQDTNYTEFVLQQNWTVICALGAKKLGTSFAKPVFSEKASTDYHRDWRGSFSSFFALFSYTIAYFVDTHMKQIRAF